MDHITGKRMEAKASHDGGRKGAQHRTVLSTGLADDGDVSFGDMVGRVLLSVFIGILTMSDS